MLNDSRRAAQPALLRVPRLRLAAVFFADGGRFAALRLRGAAAFLGAGRFASAFFPLLAAFLAAGRLATLCFADDPFFADTPRPTPPPFPRVAPAR
jgi:hypothetical protein